MTTAHLQPRFTQALCCILGIVALVFSGLFVIKTSLHSVILLSIFWVMMHALALDPDMVRLKHSMSSVLQRFASIFLFFILIGAVIAAFTLSGAIPTLIYYGLSWVSPQIFLPIGMLLCSMMSLAIGSTWGTIGTMGVALIGVASILHIPLPLAAGMIVSGAYFGDKFSPVSDTTILSALTTETNLYKHIKGMTYSIIPAYLISLGIFWGIGKYYTSSHPIVFTELTLMRHLIQVHFNTGLITLLPMAVMLGMSLKKKPAELSMLVALVVALCIAYFVQKTPIATGLNSLFSGARMQGTGSAVLDATLNRGGIQSMLWSMSLATLVLVLGGMLESYQFITVLFRRILKHLTSPLLLVLVTMLASVVCNLLMGEAYLSIILSARIFKRSYDQMGLDSCVLSKAIEEGSTFSTPLIPWTTSGAFISTTLGVSSFDYLSWSIFNWIAPAVFLLFVGLHFMGVKMYFSEGFSPKEWRCKTI